MSKTQHLELKNEDSHLLVDPPENDENSESTSSPGCSVVKFRKFLHYYICSILIISISIIPYILNIPNTETNPSPFLEKLGCRNPKMIVSARNIPHMENDDDDVQTTNLYYQIASWKAKRKTHAYFAEPLYKNGENSDDILDYDHKSEIIEINKSNNLNWITFQPVDAVMIAEWCWAGCDEENFKNWSKMDLKLWYLSNDGHFFSQDDKIADFYFGYGDGIFVNKPPGIFSGAPGFGGMDIFSGVENQCQLDPNNENEFNRGFYVKGRYEVAWCSDEYFRDSGKQLQVKMEFYCE